MTTTRVEQSFWVRHRHVLAYVFLFVVACLALTREEQLRQQTEHDVRLNVIAQIQRTQHRSCIEQNRARSAANDSARSLKSFINVIIHQGERRLSTQHGQDRRITQAGLMLYRDLANHQHVIALVDCSS